MTSAGSVGHAAVAILDCGEGRYAWQRKTPGYPIASQVGCLCLFGGNREAADCDARKTLERELREELPSDLACEAVQSLQPFSRFMIHCSAQVMAPRSEYTFICCVFRATLHGLSLDALGSGWADNRRTVQVNEGSLEIHDLDTTLLSERFCFGYDRVFNHFLQEMHAKDGRYRLLSEPPISGCPAIDVERVSPAVDLGQWANGEETWA